MQSLGQIKADLGKTKSALDKVNAGLQTCKPA